MEPTAVPSAAPSAPAAAPGDQPIDLKQIKSMLNLPETATDIELITALVELIANLQQKYDALLSDAVKLEDKVANRDLEDFKDVIAPDTQDFWRGQLMANRDQALVVLAGLRTARAPAPAAPAPAPREPLRNRLVDQPRSLSELTGSPALVDAARAVTIRNRAHELRKAEKLPWGEAMRGQGSPQVFLGRQVLTTAEMPRCGLG